MSLFTFVAIFVALLSLSGATPQDEIHDALERTCYEMCMAKISDANMCKAFGSFTEDIAKEHMYELEEIWNLGGQKILEWAMSDTVQWKFHSGAEDPHRIAVYYLDTARSLLKIATQKDEL